MVKLNMHTEKGEGYEPPSIFRAVRNNDLYEMRSALDSGQSFHDIESDSNGFNAIHIAAICGSVDILRAATDLEAFDPWIVDAECLTAFDHAAARNDKVIMQMLFRYMYGVSSERVLFTQDPELL